VILALIAGLPAFAGAKKHKQSAAKESSACDQAFKKADSGSIPDADEAMSVCEKEVEKICSAAMDGAGGSAGDGRYVFSYCNALAAHGGYLAVKKMK
jgi:hypothetical protein